MPIRLGLVGSEDNLKLMESVAKEYADFLPISFLHHTQEEVFEVLRTNENHIDMWIFSGYLPYSSAKEELKITKPMFYISYTDTYLYKAIYSALYEHNIHMSDLSFDCLTETELSHIFYDFGQKFLPNHLTTDVCLENILTHHEKLWKSGETKGAVTCSWAVNKLLKKRGIPVFRINISVTSIKVALNEALRINEITLSKNKQIAVQIFEIDLKAFFAKNMHSSNEIYTQEIQITQKFLAYSKKIQGSLKNMSYGRYIIFSTRGELLNITNNFTVVPGLEELDKLQDQILACGIGIGQTAYEAELYASRAIQHAKEHEPGAWIVFQDNKTITGPLGREDNILFSINSEKYLNISKKTSLSASTISKVDFVLKKIGKTEISAQELASNLNIETRSAHRILDQLQRSGLAEGISEETQGVRGRPRKIFKVFFKLD